MDRTNELIEVKTKVEESVDEFNSQLSHMKDLLDKTTLYDVKINEIKSRIELLYALNSSAKYCKTMLAAIYELYTLQNELLLEQE